MQHGLTQGQLRGQRIARLAHGKYARQDDVTDKWSWARALIATLPAGTVVSHTTALRLLGCDLPWELMNDTLLHATIPPGNPYPRFRSIAAYVRQVPSRDWLTVAGIPVTTGPRTFLDLAQHLPDESLVVVGDALLRTGRITPEALTDRLSSGNGQRGIRRARSVAPLLDKGAHSPPESIFRFRIIAAGLPPPESQCEAYSATGELIGHVDLGWKQWKVAVEYEGRQHAEAGQFGYDVERYTLLSAAGWVVLRASSADLRDGSRRFLGLLRDTLISQGAPLH